MRDHKSVSLLAHRVGYQLAYPDDPGLAQLLVCHDCDYRRCVRGDHLFLGSDVGNMHDMWAKGRGVLPNVVGENNPAHKLTRGQAVEIRERYVLGGISQAKLAAEYGVSQKIVHRIHHGLAWA